VVEHAETSGSLALSRRPRGAVRTLPKAPVFGAANTLSRIPAQPAEIAQARVFERLLRAESAELQELAHRAAGEEADESAPYGELTQIRARIDEVNGLLRALQGRFPRSAPDGDR
jgi:hypothetical protein